MLIQELNSLPKKRNTPSHYSSHLYNLVILHIFFSIFFKYFILFNIFIHIFPFSLVLIQNLLPSSLFPLPITASSNYPSRHSQVEYTWDMSDCATWNTRGKQVECASTFHVFISRVFHVLMPPIIHVNEPCVFHVLMPPIIHVNKPCVFHVLMALLIHLNKPLFYTDVKV